MRALRLLLKLAGALALGVLCVGCQTEFKEWRGGGVQKGSGGACVVVDGVEMWSYGAPNRRYRVIGVLEDSRPGGVIPMARRDGNIAQEAKEHGADGVIIIGAQKENVGTLHQMNAQSFSSGNLSGNTTYMGNGNFSHYGNYSGTTSTYGSGFSAPVIKATAQYLAFKYE